MLGSALIAVQETVGTAVIAQDLETQETFIRDRGIEDPIRTIPNTQSPYRPVKRSGRRGKGPIWQQSYKCYAGEKPEVTYVIIPKSAERFDYDFLSPYGSMAEAYHYFYQRTGKFIFI